MRTRDSSPHHPAGWRLLAAAMAVAMLASRPARAADTILLLGFVVNGRDTGRIADAVQRGDDLLMTRHDLAELGLSLHGVPDGAETDPVALSRIPGISFRVDAPAALLRVTATDDSLLPTLLNAVSGQPAEVPVQHGTGFVLNYDATATKLGSTTVATGLFDARAYSEWGVAESAALLTAGTVAGSAIRLDSNFTVSDADALRRWRAGDVITGGLTWTRPVRVAGVQVTTDFSIRPDLITYPLPGIGGSVAVPSTVDVLVNSVQQLSRNIDPGPFSTGQLPVVNGAGTVSVVVRDALGQSTTQTLPFYASSALLTRGLSSYSVEIGAVRRFYGLRSDDYGSPAATLSGRHGLLPWLTVEGHAEGTPALGLGGIGAAINVANLGVATLSVAGSGARRSGTQIGFGFERVTKYWSLSGSTQIASAGYGDVAAANGDPAPRRITRLSGGVSLGMFGSLNVAYTELLQPAGTYNIGTGSNSFLVGAYGVGLSTQPFLAPPLHTRLLTASYTAELVRGIFLYATGYHDFAGGSGSGAVVGLSIPLGDRNSVGVSGGAGSGQSYTQLQATRSVTAPGDLGGQFLVSAGKPSRETGELDYKTSFGMFGAGIDHSFGQTATRALARGALVAADGALFAANRIDDSFAIVDTAGIAGVHVLQENRPAGTTNGAGVALVPDLRSYQPNRVAIDPRDVPFDADLPQAEQVVRPADRNGVVVHFAVSGGASALIRLVDIAGKPIPLGSTARLAGGGADGASVPVGYDGEAYVQGLSAHNDVAVTLPSGHVCSAHFDFVARHGSLPTIGPVPCREDTAK